MVAHNTIQSTIWNSSQPAVSGPASQAASQAGSSTYPSVNSMSSSSMGSSSINSTFAHPSVQLSVDVHEFSLLEGDVSIGAHAVVAPGVAVTAEAGASVAVGEQCVLLPGVIVEAIAGAQIRVGSQTSQSTARATSGAGLSNRYSVWLGDRTVIAHKSLIHSPAFIGQDCFIGFRSTVFNARLGNGCVVMMHALVQDVEIPPGKCVPSGSVITSQHQADQLPQVRPEDLEFAREIVGTSVTRVSSSASRGPSSAQSRPRLVPVNSPSHPFSTAHSVSANVSPTANHNTTSYSAHLTPLAANRHPSQATEGAHMQAIQTQRLSPETVQQVRQHLSQGYRIGMEHADLRRYRSGVWETCTPIKDTREQAVFEALERCLAEHSGEYVRMFGIDPNAKRRVGMVTVQRPGSPAASNGQAVGTSFGSTSAYGANGNGGSNGRSAGSLSPEVVQEVRNLLRSGHIIGTEHADTRHYRSNVWKSCSPISSQNDQEVFSRLEHCLDEHSDEFVRMFGINPTAKRRTASITIQRADGKPVSVTPSRATGNAQSSAHPAPQSGYAGASYGQSSGQPNQNSAQNNLQNGEAAQVVSQILSQGGKIGVEVADTRRYRSGLWQTVPSLASLSQLQNFLSQNADKYVRVFGVNAAMKTRGATTTIQKPGQSGAAQSAQSGSQGRANNAYSSSGRDPINSNPPHYDDPAYLKTGVGYANQNGEAAQVVSQILSQGGKIGVEIADTRRYRSGLWQTMPSLASLSQLQNFLSQNADKYVRVFGVNAAMKTRGATTTIQKPGQSGAAQSAQSGSQGRANNAYSSSGRDPINSNPPHYDDPAYLKTGVGNSGSGNGAIDAEVVDQVTQLVNQGCRISVEFADKRRFRSGIWQTGPSIDARRPAEAMAALGKQLAQHQGDYVRLVGVDPQAKRRVVETTIQRP
jgi:carbon dioxide concentrating mechanism protein CcmM